MLCRRVPEMLTVSLISRCRAALSSAMCKPYIFVMFPVRMLSVAPVQVDENLAQEFNLLKFP